MQPALARAASEHVRPKSLAKLPMGTMPVEVLRLAAPSARRMAATSTWAKGQSLSDL